MFTPTRSVARPMLAGMFVFGGLDAVRHADTKVAKADKVAPSIARRLGLPEDTRTLVRINGVAQIMGGSLLAVGKMPRIASTVLAASLVPTTVAGHRFWEEDDPAQRRQQQIEFLKNTAMMGGLLLAAVDTSGRPSVSWRVRRATRRHARPAANGVIATLGHEAGRLGETAADRAAELARSAAGLSRAVAETGGDLARGVSRTAAGPGAELVRAVAGATRDAAGMLLEAGAEAGGTVADVSHDAAAMARRVAAGSGTAGLRAALHG